MAEWDDDNFEPREVTTAALSNKWEGEDEDDEVKESWEDEEEEKKPQQEEEVMEVKSKLKKKNLQEKIAEKERLKREEYEKRVKEPQEEEISPEEQMRRQKESDLKLALETTFCSKSDGVQPTTKEEFQDLAESLTKNIQQLSKNDEYPAFAENLVRGVCASLNSFDLKKIKTTIDNLYLEKQKVEKGDKAKKNKGKGKAKLKVEGDNVSLNQYSAYVDDFNDYDDFM